MASRRSKKPPTVDTSAVAKAAIAKLSPEEIREIHRLIQKAIYERDLPKFKEGLLKLKFDETSKEYERMMQLWDEQTRASRHG
jgi:hypothetical protein